MTTYAPVADTENKTVTLDGTTYQIQELGDDEYVVLDAGVPVGRIVYSFGAGNGVPEGSAISEDALTAIAESWFTALEG